MENEMEPKNEVSGPSAAIHADAVYSREHFLRIVPIGDGGFRAARRNGLRVHYAHGSCFILGRDWLQYVSEMPTEAPGPKQGTVPRCVQQKLPFPDDED